MIDFIIGLVATGFAIVCFSGAACLVWVPVSLVFLIVYTKLSHKTIDINEISEFKLIVSSCLVPYFLGVGLLYWFRSGRESHILNSILIGGAIGIFYAAVGVFAFFLARGIGSALLFIFEKWASSYIDLKRSIRESYEKGPIPVVMGIIVALCYLKGKFFP